MERANSAVVDKRTHVLGAVCMVLTAVSYYDIFSSVHHSCFGGEFLFKIQTAVT